MAWQLIGSATITPNTVEAEVGPIEVPTFGGIQVKVRQVEPTPFKWGYGLLSYRSLYGLELGTVKVWPRLEFTNYLLGPGQSVADNIGVLVLEPRTWNLRWVKAGFPLTVEVLADLNSDLPLDRYLSDGFADSDGAPLLLTLAGSTGRLNF